MGKPARLRCDHSDMQLYPMTTIKRIKKEFAGKPQAKKKKYFTKKGCPFCADPNL
jgi:hypothetical protein